MISLRQALPGLWSGVRLRQGQLHMLSLDWLQAAEAFQDAMRVYVDAGRL